jgi:hypothetical protein
MKLEAPLGLHAGECLRMQAIVRGQRRSLLWAGVWVIGSSLLGDEDSIVKKSPNTKRPVSTPPINIINSSCYALCRGRFLERHVVFGLHFLKRMGDRLGFQQLKTCTLSAKPFHLHSDTEPQSGNGAVTVTER